MTREEIINSNNTKTWKIAQLLEAGMSRREVADLMQVGYGFVQNVFANTFPERVRTRTRIEAILAEAGYSITEFRFEHTFGVEMELFGINKQNVIRKLREAGIEIEDEGYNHITREHWKIVTDSSVTGENACEIVSPKLKGEEGLRSLERVCMILEESNAKINKTCGLHIHFDAEKFSNLTWKNIFINYSKLEKEIDAFMPESRRESKNVFCKTIKRENPETLLAGVTNSQTTKNSLEEIKRKFGIGSRYYKVNCESYWRHKSIEFRQHSGTVNFEKISNWILFLARLIEFSKQGTTDDFRSFLPEDLMRYIAKRKRELA